MTKMLTTKMEANDRATATVYHMRLPSFLHCFNEFSSISVWSYNIGPTLYFVSFPISFSDENNETIVRFQVMLPTTGRPCCQFLRNKIELTIDSKCIDNIGNNLRCCWFSRIFFEISWTCCLSMSFSTSLLTPTGRPCCQFFRKENWIGNKLENHRQRHYVSDSFLCECVRLKSMKPNKLETIDSVITYLIHFCASVCDWNRWIFLCSFAAQNNEELSFVKGERLEILDRPPADPDWYRARNKTGSVGLVPKNYVQVHPSAKIPRKFASTELPINFVQPISLPLALRGLLPWPIENQSCLGATTTETQTIRVPWTEFSVFHIWLGQLLGL